MKKNNNIIFKPINERFKYIFDELNKLQTLTKVELAKRIGIQPQHINRFFTGESSFTDEILYNLQNEFGVSITYLVMNQGLPLIDIDKAKSRIKKETEANAIEPLNENSKMTVGEMTEFNNDQILDLISRVDKLEKKVFLDNSDRESTSKAGS